MSAASRRERSRKRARRTRRREEAERRAAAEREAAQRAREERLVRLGPVIELFGEGSELTRAIDRLSATGAIGVTSLSALPRHPMARREKRICHPDGSVTHVHESCGFRFETTYAGLHRAEAS